MGAADGKAPEYLYKYRSLAQSQRDFTRDIIVNQRLWCGPASDLNDPYDCCPVPYISSDRDARQAQLLEVLAGANPNLARTDVETTANAVLAEPDDVLDKLMAQAVDQVRGKIGVISLSASPDIPEMWQRYADAYRGICLRFRDPPDAKPMFSQARRVSYVPDRPRVEAVLEPGPSFIDAFLLTKTNDWAYEQEWRLVHPKWTGSARFQPAALDAIVLGAAISPEDRVDVLEWVRASGLAIEIVPDR
ncbi:MAG: DUF2971 domain-containing protein [Sphingomonadales bacterium]|nr:MAG: DUF2971 domain-containing protein [Sphingomonadales bacterium]